MRRLWNIFYLGIISLLQGQNFAINPSIDSLKQEADAVILFDSTQINLIRQNKMIIKKKTAITIFRTQADDLAEVTLLYDKNNKIKDVFLSFYDENGNLLRKADYYDFEDMTAAQQFTLYTDSRILHYFLPALPHPFTVYIEYTLDKKNTAFIPAWNPIPDYQIAVRQSSYLFTYPPEIHLQISKKNLEKFSVVSKENIAKLFYEIKDFPPIKEEPLSPPLFQRVPYVKLAVSPFYLAGIKGEGGTLKKIGQWIYRNLLEPQSGLPETTKNYIHKLTEDAHSPYEKAKRIYEYMQNKTHYVNISIGIGGWKPMSATQVDRLGYGDCKALTNYTRNLLEAVGIPSFYTLIYGGETKRNIDKNLAALQGNHAILCVPIEQDTLWLECTNPLIPFGLKSSFIDDRDVMVITPNGAYIRHTAAYTADENLFNLKGNFKVDSLGNITYNAHADAYGWQLENSLQNFEGLQDEKLSEEIGKIFQLNNLLYIEAQINNNKKEGKFEMDIRFKKKNYMLPIQKNIFMLPVNPLNRNTFVPSRLPERQTPLVISRGFKDIDMYIIEIPSSYQVYDLPKAVNFSEPFGKYSLEVSRKDATHLFFQRQLIIYEGIYEKEDYEAYRKFRKKIKKYENSSVLLSR